MKLAALPLLVRQIQAMARSDRPGDTLSASEVSEEAEDCRKIHRTEIHRYLKNTDWLPHPLLPVPEES
jgi:hypothetical protein